MKKIYFLVLAFYVFNGLSAQVVNIPDYGFYEQIISGARDVNDDILEVDANNNGQIEISEASKVYSISVLYGGSIRDFTGINSFTSLRSFSCNDFIADKLDVTNLNNLEYLDLLSSNLTNLNVSGLKKLTWITCRSNSLISINLNGCSNLKKLDLNSNKELKFLDVSSCKNLETLYCSGNSLSALDVRGLTNLVEMDCSGNLLAALDINGLTNLATLYCHNNKLSKLNFGTSVNITNLACNNNELTTLDISTLKGITYFGCTNNNLTTLDVSHLPNLVDLRCDNNKISLLNVSNCPSLTGLYCNDNNLTELDLLDSNIISLNCNNNKLEYLDLSKASELYYLNLVNNLFTSLDLSNLSAYFTLDCSNNPFLKSLNLKNGWLTQVADNVGYVNGNYVSNGPKSYVFFDNCPVLEYICDDDFDFKAMKNVIDNYKYSNCTLNSYCSFKPGGTYFTIQGNTKIDLTKNGCDALDITYPKLKFDITDGVATGSLISDITGLYNIPMQEGTHTITPFLENPYYFSIFPTSTTLTFPAQASPYLQNFCITANGTYSDLEISLLTIDSARPGFDAKYKLIYKNKGTVVQSGEINLAFDDTVLDLIISNPAVSSQNTNNLSWSFSNLQPLETREITFTQNVNGPMETPAVNNGAILKFTATITSKDIDETPIDNAFTLNQTVVNSFDPNDKTCLEGDIITPSLIGQYVHYLIRFENTGTYPAQNIVVKDMIDLSKFDISTLVPTSSSHSYITKISEGNKVEFIFENVNLPFDDANNDGYIAFKIKTLPTLVIGDSFDNEANIYFDYNFPVLTNKATSTFKTTLDKSDFEFSNYLNAYPIPANEVLNIATKKDIEIQSIAVYDVLGQLVIALPNIKDVSKIDVSNLRTGNYFIKIKSDKGSAVMKFIKN